MARRLIWMAGEGCVRRATGMKNGGAMADEGKTTEVKGFGLVPTGESVPENVPTDLGAMLKAKAVEVIHTNFTEIFLVITAGIKGKNLAAVRLLFELATKYGKGEQVTAAEMERLAQRLVATQKDVAAEKQMVIEGDRADLVECTNVNC